MDMGVLDCPGELVASTLRERCFERSVAKANCLLKQGVNEHVRDNGLTALASPPHLTKVQRQLLGSCHLGFSMAGLNYGRLLPVTNIIMKTVIAQQELDDNLFVKCQKCGEMISANMDAIDEHSVVCQPIKCRQCGQMISANIDAIEAHSAVCLPIVECWSASCQQPVIHTPHGMVGAAHGGPCVPHSLRSPGDDYAMGRSLFDVASSNLACLSQGSLKGPFVPQHADEQFLKQLRLEVHSQIEALRAQQLAAVSPSPVQIIVDNCSTASAFQSMQHEQLPAIPSQSPDMWWCDLLSSPTSRMILFTTAYLSVYFAQGYLNHGYRMAEIQQRIDANAFLRFQQILSKQLTVLL